MARGRPEQSADRQRMARPLMVMSAISAFCRASGSGCPPKLPLSAEMSMTRRWPLMALLSISSWLKAMALLIEFQPSAWRGAVRSAAAKASALSGAVDDRPGHDDVLRVGTTPLDIGDGDLAVETLDDGVQDLGRRDRAGIAVALQRHLRRIDRARAVRREHELDVDRDGLLRRGGNAGRCGDQSRATKQRRAPDDREPCRVIAGPCSSWRRRLPALAFALSASDERLRHVVREIARLGQGSRDRRTLVRVHAVGPSCGTRSPTHADAPRAARHDAATRLQNERRGQPPLPSSAATRQARTWSRYAARTVDILLDAGKVSMQRGNAQVDMHRKCDPAPSPRPSTRGHVVQNHEL